jgi:hypothetical protein
MPSIKATLASHLGRVQHEPAMSEFKIANEETNPSKNVQERSSRHTRETPARDKMHKHGNLYPSIAGPSVVNSDIHELGKILASFIPRVAEDDSTVRVYDLTGFHPTNAQVTMTGNTPNSLRPDAQKPLTHICLYSGDIMSPAYMGPLRTAPNDVRQYWLTTVRAAVQLASDKANPPRLVPPPSLLPSRLS